LWKYIYNNPLRVGYIGDQSERFAKGGYSDEDGYDYGVASENILYQSDCEGILEITSELPEVGWSGYLINHTRKMYITTRNGRNIYRRELFQGKTGYPARIDAVDVVNRFGFVQNHA